MIDVCLTHKHVKADKRLQNRIKSRMLLVYVASNSANSHSWMLCLKPDVVFSVETHWPQGFYTGSFSSFSLFLCSIISIICEPQ